ncbi:OprO/OprP family phosphate-selective porin [Maricaulis sp. CAU 1757]
MTRLLTTTAIATLVSATSLAPAHAEGWEFDGVPSWSNSDGDSFTFRGRIFLDAAEIDFEEAGVTTTFSDTEIRTARLGVTGSLSDVDYTAEFDLIDEEITAKDVHLTFDAGAFDIRVGHFKTPNSLEEETSSRYITFMERGQATDLFGLDRRVGAMVSGGGENYTLSAGVFGGTLDDLSESFEIDDSSAVAARATWAPIHGDELSVHLGGSARYMDYGDAGTRVRVRPNTHITPRIVTADFRPGRPLGEAESSLLLGVEAAVVAGPFHAQSEIMTMELDGPLGEPLINSGYVSLGYFITGETRSYSASSGKFGRTRPASPVSEGGLGAVELAVRYDRSDLEQAREGVLTTLTLGVNWYLEDKLRIMANYVDGERSIVGAPNTDVSGAQVRVQWDF